MVAYLGEDFLDTEWGLGSDIIFDIRFHRSGKFTELLHVLNRDRLHFHLYFLILCFRGFLTLITRARHQQGQRSYRYYFQHLTCLHIIVPNYYLLNFQFLIFNSSVRYLILSPDPPSLPYSRR